MITDIEKILSFTEWLNRPIVGLEKSWLRRGGGRMQLKMRQKSWMAMTECNNERGIEWRDRVNKKGRSFICPLTHLDVSCHAGCVATKSLHIFQKQPGKGREERPSKGPQYQPRPPWGACRAQRGWRGGRGRYYLCLWCLVVCTLGKLAAAGGSLWRAFVCTLSSCSHGLKMESVIGNFIQLLTACPKATQLPKRKNVALVKRTRLAWNRQM